MESLSSRRGTLENMDQGEERARLEFLMPSRALFGYRSSFLSMTAGEGLLNHTFDSYQPRVGEIRSRPEGSLVAMEAGTTFAYSMFKLQERGEFFINPGDEVYVGMIIGSHIRAGDLVLNVSKNKKMTNVRASSADENIVRVPTCLQSLGAALEFTAYVVRHL